MLIEPQKENNHETRPRVLIVDDSNTIRQAMCFILGSECEVTSVENGDKAFGLISQGADFDVVSLDLEMPGMTGIETLKAIKEWNPNTEVLIVTAHSDLDSAKEALKLGAYDYIDKPFEKEVYREVVRKGIERRSKSIASEKAQEELSYVKAQLIQSEKFAALGQLIAGFAHEINNPLGAILGLTELLLMKEWSPEEIRDYLEKINNGAQLSKNIVEKFLAFSRKYEKKREHIQVNTVIESTLDLKQHDFKRDRIQVVRNLAGHMPGTMADFHELQQVFLNVINNAHQAMKEQSGTGFLTIKSEFDDRAIRISFQDTGPGIPQENLQKIFEPLFTTKEIGKGTGLGLSLSCEIIKEHGGDFYVASELGKGACFVIELPIISD